jgi:diacylglycerol kinase
VKPSSWPGTLNCAIEGLVHAARTQRNMIVHLLAAALAVLAGWLAALPPSGFALLFLAIGLVIACEVMNSALEAVVDLLAPQYAERARHAKDMAAGAVLVAVFAAVLTGLMVFYPHARRLLAWAAG